MADNKSKKSKLGVLSIIGLIVLIVGALATAGTVAQMAMGVGGDAAHLIVGIVIVIAGLAMATRKKQQ